MSAVKKSKPAEADIKLLRDNILVLPEPALQSKYIKIPDTIKQEYQMGRVAKVGPGWQEKVRKGDKLVLSGRFIPMDVKVGDVVFYGPHVGQPQKILGVLYLAMQQRDVAAILDAPDEDK